MECGKLASYMEKWGPDENVGIMVCDTAARLAYRVTGYELCEEAPLLILEVGKPEGLDKIIQEAIAD